MEAVCPQCQVRYAISEELLQQGTPILCPTCQVELIMVQPGTSIPLQQDPQSDGPEEPIRSWDSGDLLWGGPDAGDAPGVASQPEAGQEQTAQQPPQQPEPTAAGTPAGGESWGAAPTWDAAEPQAPVAEPASQAAPAADVPPQPASVTGKRMEDWASEAARWAASGFATDNMPAFVKNQEAGTGAPQPQPAAEPPAQPAAEPTAQPAAAQQPDQSAPPPLPAQEKPEIESPRPATPPPLEGRATSYVMKGSGEGLKDEMSPWLQESEPPPVEADQKASIPLPTPHPEAEPFPAQEPVAAAAKPEPVPEPKPKSSAAGKVLAVLVVLALVAAGGYAAWFFYKASKEIKAEPDRADGAAVAGPSKGPKPEKPAEEPSKPETGEATGGKDQVASRTDLPPKKPGDEPKVPGKEPGGDATAKDKPGVKPKPSDKRPRPRPGRKVAKINRELALKHYKKGNEFIRKRKFKAALNFFRKALKADKRLAQAHRGLGISYAQLRQNKKACQEYRTYLKMIPSSSKEVPNLRKILEGCK